MNTIWQTIITLAAIKPAANRPQARDTSVMPRIKRSIGERFPLAPAKRIGGFNRRSSCSVSFHRQRFIDQLLAVGHFARELFIGAVLRDLQPRVVFGGTQGGDLDVVLLE